MSGPELKRQPGEAAPVIAVEREFDAREWYGQPPEVHVQALRALIAELMSAVDAAGCEPFDDLTMFLERMRREDGELVKCPDLDDECEVAWVRVQVHVRPSDGGGLFS